ncbi:AAA family ATPase [Ferroplasma acidiphilum]|jgi:MoxR-like ATPase|uniref:AAA domain-containing protein n=1 Tax=Ferroplasma acidiphilum TaxID=74969 RepID=A0A7K4FKD5_9ARCH|nr:AAA family ATPase [Ferroplasma acidiphilum]MCL4348594.1 AAA family ATPase [Candidatus Thermoplasmatota archaeon]NOL59503.1 AAA domain-containing protein [Ferroplasma acidiphilum]
MKNINKIFEVKNYLTDTFVGREDVINGVLAGLISGEPTLLVGPPGTAKTSIIDTMSKLINARYFYYLLTKFTEPEELLGPIDITALKNGEYRNITKGKLPDANIVFLDEIFKSSSAIRNTLLDIMLNRRLPNGGTMINLDLLGIYSASNEISDDEEDMALYDRYPIKIFHRYVERTILKDLLDKGISMESGKTMEKPLLDTGEVVMLQSEAVRRMDTLRSTDNDVIDRYMEAIFQLEENDVILSDRRKIKLLKIAAAFSILMDSKTITGNDVAMAMRYSADSEDYIPKIEAAIIDSKLENKSDIVQKAETTMEETKSLIQSTENAINRNSPYNVVLDQLSLLEIYIKKLERMKFELGSDNSPYHKDIVNRINTSLEFAGSRYEKLKGR